MMKNMINYKDSEMEKQWSDLTVNGEKLIVPEYLENPYGEKIKLEDADFVPVYDPSYGVVWCQMYGSDFVDIDGTTFGKFSGAMLVSDLPENNKVIHSTVDEDSTENDNCIYLTVDKDGTEVMWAEKPSKIKGIWNIKDPKFNNSFIVLPKGTIEKLTGKELTYKNGVYYYEG